MRTHFRAFAGSTHGFVDFDRGLGELSRHAKRLGYDAVAFFFDELVLWLASGATDRAWLNREIGKLAKMAAYTKAPRATFAVMHPLKAVKYGAIYMLVRGLTRRS